MPLVVIPDNCMALALWPNVSTSLADNPAWLFSLTIINSTWTLCPKTLGTLATEVLTSWLFDIVFLVKVGKALAMAHPEAKTSLRSQTITMVCLVLVPILLVDLTNFDNAWALEGALCLEHFLGNVATWILSRNKGQMSLDPDDKEFNAASQV